MLDGEEGKKEKGKGRMGWECSLARVVGYNRGKAILAGEGLPCHPFDALTLWYTYNLLIDIMGADGGSIPDRSDLVKTKARTVQTDKAHLRELFFFCALSKVSAVALPIRISRGGFSLDCWRFSADVLPSDSCPSPWWLIPSESCTTRMR